MKIWLFRIVKAIVALEIIYLLLLNIALNLPWTQSLINGIDSDRYQVSWSRAWSFYPFDLHVLNLDAHGSTNSLKWRVKSPDARAALSPAGLLRKTIKATRADLRDIYYAQQRLMDSQEEPSAGKTAPPPVPRANTAGREAAPRPAQSDPQVARENGWNVIIDRAQVSGSHEIVLDEAAARVNGEMIATFAYRADGKVISVEHGSVNLQIESLMIGPEQEVVRNAHLEGSMELRPLSLQQKAGVRALNNVAIDAQVQLETERLAFMNVYLENFNNLKVDGTGLVKGRLHLDHGRLEPPTDLEVSARTLVLEAQSTQLVGDGTIVLQAEDSQERANVLITFAKIEAFDTDSESLLFSGHGLKVEAQGSPYILADAEHPFIMNRLAAIIPEVEVPDLHAFQAYLPEKWPLQLHGGTGSLQGVLVATQTGLENDLRLTSDAADLGFETYRFTSDLDMRLKLDSPSLLSGIDASGSYIRLEGTTLAGDTGESSKAWQTAIEIKQGTVKLMLPDSVSEDSGFKEIYQMLKGRDIGGLLSSGGEEIRIVGSISDLAWLSVLLKNSYGLAISGSGEVVASLYLSEGWLDTGSEIRIQPQTLGVDVLDYHAEGNGAVSLLVEEGGERPDLKLDIELHKAAMGRKGESQEFIEEVTMLVEAEARAVSMQDEKIDMNVHLAIPSARIIDMSVYNDYLPPDSPFAFTGGSAELTSDISLTPDSADGFVKLRAHDMSAHVDQQDVEGELAVDITLIDGVPEQMDFDISGSTVVLDNVRVAGGEAGHDDENWAARFLLKKGRVLWKRPISLQVKADLEMSDSKPFVAVIANKRGKQGWLEKALTIDDVHGEADIRVANKRIVIPYSLATSDKIDVGAKGVIAAGERSGVLYVRFRGLHAILKIKDGQRNLDVLKARETFDQYEVGQ